MPNLQNSSQYRSVNGFPFTLSGAALLALPSGALWWPEHELLCVSDLHLGKAERISRKGGANLPPYEIAWRKLAWLLAAWVRGTLISQRHEVREVTESVDERCEETLK